MANLSLLSKKKMRIDENPLNGGVICSINEFFVVGILLKYNNLFFWIRNYEMWHIACLILLDENKDVGMNEEKRNFYLKNLTHPDAAVRKEAVLKLGAEREPFLFKILSTYFSDGHPEVRDALYQVFVSVRQRWVAEIVVDVLYSPQISVRSLAMEILKTLGAISIFPLRRLVVSENREMRRIAAELFGDIPDPHSSEILLSMLEDKDEYVLFAVIESLGKLREIHAIPRLMTLAEGYPRLKPAILSALANTFMHWEKVITNTGIPDSDPVQVMSFLVSIQESGLSTAFSPILKILAEDAFGLGEEAIKALAEILKKNPHLTLPHSLLPVLISNKERYRTAFLYETFLTCLSAIPAAESFRLLVKEAGEDKTKVAREKLRFFLKRYPSFLVSEYARLKPEDRLQCLEILGNENVAVYDEALFEIYPGVENPREKEMLLKVISQSTHPRTTPFLIQQLSRQKGEIRAQILKYLAGMGNEELWQIFLQHLEDEDHEVREAALQGLLRYPGKTARYVQTRLERGKPSQIARWLDVAFALPISYAENVLNQWLKKEAEKNIDLLKEHLKASGKVKDFIIAGLVALQYPELEEKFFSRMKIEEKKLLLDAESRKYWGSLEPAARERLRYVLRNIPELGSGLSPEHLPDSFASQSRNKMEVFPAPESEMMSF